MIVARFGEIFLKSKPVKKRFKSQLINNIQTAVDGKVSRKRLRILVYQDEEEEAIKKLGRVFGIVSFSPAEETKPDIDEVKEIAREKTKNWEGTFAVRAQRITKDYSFTSKDVEEEVGAVIQGETGLEVDLDDPDNVFYAEFYGDDAYVFTEKIKGPGGLPLGVSGTLEASLENENDLLACWMMMKRGCLIKTLKTDSRIKKAFEKWNQTDKKPGRVFGSIKSTLDVDEVLLKEKREKPVYTSLIGLNEKELENLRERVFS